MTKKGTLMEERSIKPPIYPIKRRGTLVPAGQVFEHHRCELAPGLPRSPFLHLTCEEPVISDAVSGT